MRFELEAFFRYFVLIIIAILACYFIPAIIINLLLSYGRTIPFWIQPALTVCAIIILSYVLYQGYERKQILYFSTVFSIVGIFLVLMGLVIQLPYSAQEYYRQDVSTDMTKNLWYPTSIYPTNNDVKQLSGDYTNDSLRIEILPFETKAYYWRSEWISWRYSDYLDYHDFPPYIPTLQIDVGGYGNLDVKLVAFKNVYSNVLEIDEVLIDSKMLATWYVTSLKAWESRWEYFFWIPAKEGSYHHDIGLIFENPNSQPIVFSFKVTKIQVSDGYRTVTRYQPPLQPEYTYAGLCLVSVAFLLELYAVVRKLKRKRLSLC